MNIEEIRTQAAVAGRELTEAVAEVLEVLRGLGDAPEAGDVLSDLAQYAWAGIPGTLDHAIEERLTEACTQIELLQGNLMNPSGEGLVAEGTPDFIRTIVTAAQARQSLDEGESIRIEDLAALARVSERTIRAATSSKNPNAIPITKNGHWTLIEAKDALAWLGGRSDFVPTRTRHVGPNALALQTSVAPGPAWKRWREAAGHSLADLAKQLGWTQEQESLYDRVENDEPFVDALRLNPGFWLSLAKHLDGEDPARLAALTYQAIASQLVVRQVAIDLPATS